jgi:rhamnulokinase
MEWQENGLDAEYDSLLRRLSVIDDTPALIFPDDPRFLSPLSMLEAVSQQLAETGQRVPEGVPALTKVILDSLAFRYASVVNSIRLLTGQTIHGIQIVGGGSKNGYLNQATANASGLPVFAGPAEATVTGNIVVQAIASGRLGSLEEARRCISTHSRVQKFIPQPTTAMEKAARRYAAIEGRWIEDEAALVHHLSG